MATRAPARPTLQKIPARALVDEIADHDLPGRGLLLIVAFQAKLRVAGNQHLLVHAPMRIVARGAAFPHRFVFEDVRPALLRVAFETGVIDGRMRGVTAVDGPAFVRVMAVRATDAPFLQRMMIGKAEIAALLQMALKAGFWIAAGVDNRPGETAGLGMEASRAMARFATDVFRIFPFGLQTRVVGRFELPVNLLMTLLAVL